eukprot:468956_1
MGKRHSQPTHIPHLRPIWRPVRRNRLIDLLEELSGRSVPHARRVRAMSVNMRRNRASQFSICGDTLRFIRDEGINIVNVNIGDILDGNIRIILGLIWQLILYYRIS